MKTPFNQSFFRFFMGFLAIISMAFIVMLTASSNLDPHAVDNVASPE